MRTYKKPVMNVEHFVPNEFVAACGDENKVYKFKCDSGEDFIKIFGTSISAWGDVILDDGTLLTPDGFIPGSGYYHPCGETHETSANSEFHHGKFVLNAGIDGVKGVREIDVMVWRGKNGDDVHCTTNVDMSSWETIRS